MIPTAVLRAEDPLTAAWLRGVEMRRRILKAEGGTLSAPKVSKLLKISRQAVE